MRKPSVYIEKSKKEKKIHCPHDLSPGITNYLSRGISSRLFILTLGSYITVKFYSTKEAMIACMPSRLFIGAYSYSALIFQETRGPDKETCEKRQEEAARTSPLTSSLSLPGQQGAVVIEDGKLLLSVERHKQREIMKAEWGSSGLLRSSLAEVRSGATSRPATR